MISQEVLQQGALLLVDKPHGWTSFDVVKKIRTSFNIKKVGHAGTLDPLATGLLIICTGKMTKQIDNYQALEKEYVGTMVLGKTTPSIDLETDVDSTSDTSHLTEQEIVEHTIPFCGWIDQVPPVFSAIKLKGKRVYKMARRGEAVKLQSRKVHIGEFKITRCEIPDVDFKVSCSKGTYIRSLVRDLGKSLGVGAHLTALQRTAIGEYRLEHAFTIENLIKQIK
ncbi:MAG: tRNA pseudouridine(55) synthase TruB [Cyclobacteriaceae bacterium]